MNMLDKDFDQLFHSKVNAWETEPSPEVWAKVATEINSKKNSVSGLNPLLKMAATIIVIIGAGLLFKPDSDKITLYGQYTGKMPESAFVPVKVASPDALVATGEHDSNHAIVQQVGKRAGRIASNHNQTARKLFKAMNNGDTTERTANIALQDAKTDNTFSMVTTVVPPGGGHTPVAQSGDLHVKMVNTIALNTTAIIKDNATAKKKKIRSLGDLLNIVIAKVDKGPKKIIEFNDDDDDDDSFNPTRINLGLIKTKKDN